MFPLWAQWFAAASDLCQKECKWNLPKIRGTRLGHCSQKQSLFTCRIKNKTQKHIDYMEVIQKKKIQTNKQTKKTVCHPVHYRPSNLCSVWWHMLHPPTSSHDSLGRFRKWMGDRKKRSQNWLPYGDCVGDETQTQSTIRQSTDV